MKPLRFAPYGASIAVALLLATGSAWSQFTTLDEYGNAVGTDPPAGFTQATGTITITGGGADFWGNSDGGVFLWNETGSQTTTGDFTATVRHVSTTTPAPEWGRDGIMVRATQSPGTLSATDAHWLVHRKSNGVFVTGRRPTASAGTFRTTDIGNPDIDINAPGDPNDRSFATGSVTNTPFYLSAGRQGNRLYSGYARDLDGNGLLGRWVQHWSTDKEAAVGGLQNGAEVVVGLAHQAHGTAVPLVNTATFDNWSYNGSFQAGRFGAASGPEAWQMAGSASADTTTGAVTGSAYVVENGAATGESLKWTVTAYKASSYVPSFGLAGSRKDLTLMEIADLVPAANFRHLDQASAPQPGLQADIFLAPNAGNFAALDTLTQNEPNGSTVIPNIYWGHPDSGVGYPTNGMGGNLFTDAVPEFNNATDGQEDYGVDVTGQLFIPADTNRKNYGALGELVIFKDGVDDFCYLEVDGVVMIDDNNWTGASSIDNGGGNISMMDVSDPKYNDGEWVSFRLLMWEGGGGDIASLYWSVSDVNDTFKIRQVPERIGERLLAVPGLAGAKKGPLPNEVDDLVPEANLRHIENGNPVPGVKADIYLTPGGNTGTLAAWDLIVQNPPDGTAILPNIFWANGNPSYPDNGLGGNLFADAVPDNFGGNQENYGVNMTGEILIPGDSERTTLNIVDGTNYIVFEDGVDDFCYLEVDGQVLINDNDWTGAQSDGASQNGGGAVSLMDVSAAKFNDGEWVPFRMVMWEGGGGDAAALYWSALDTNESYPPTEIPGTYYNADAGPVTGFSQVGSHNTSGNFGNFNLPAGEWILSLVAENTGASYTNYSRVTVNAGPAGPQVASFSYDPGTTTLNLSFSSVAGTNYALEYTTGFQPSGAPAAAAKWNVVPGYTSIPGVAGTTAITPLNTSTLVAPGGQLPDNTTSFFRVRRL